jgi:thymidylate synthase
MVITMKIFDYFKKIHDIKNVVIERERKIATRERLNLIKQHEKALKNQADDLRKEFSKTLNQKLETKQDEIDNLKKLIRYIKNSGENIQILSSEFEIELRSLLTILGKMQNRFGNIEDRAFRETKKIEKKVDRFIQQEEI